MLSAVTLLLQRANHFIYFRVDSTSILLGKFEDHLEQRMGRRVNLDQGDQDGPLGRKEEQQVNGLSPLGKGVYLG